MSYLKIHTIKRGALNDRRYISDHRKGGGNYSAWQINYIEDISTC